MNEAPNGSTAPITAIPRPVVLEAIPPEKLLIPVTNANPLDVPEEISTIFGPMPTSMLHMVDGCTDDANECTVWREFYFTGQADDALHVNKLVHRSVHVTLKQPAVFAEAIAADIG